MRNSKGRLIITTTTLFVDGAYDPLYDEHVTDFVHRDSSIDRYIYFWKSDHP